MLRENQICFNTILGEIILNDLKVIQNGEQKPSKFILHNQNSIGFEISGINPLLPFLIDPIIWSTYFFPSLLTNCDPDFLGPIVDNTGNPVVASYTNNSNYPTTPGAYQRILAGSIDICVTKFNSSASDLFFSTFIGGNDTDYLTHLRTSNGEDIFLFGETRSTNYPTTQGTLNRTPCLFQTHFITKLNSSGSNLIYSTFFSIQQEKYTASTLTNMAMYT